MRIRPEQSRLAKVAVVAVVAAIALSVASIVLVVHQLGQVRAVVSVELPAPRVSGNAELIRCRDLGMPAAEDESCLAAWAAERLRFLGTEPEPAPSGQPPADGAAEEAVEDTQSGIRPIVP